MKHTQRLTQWGPLFATSCSMLISQTSEYYFLDNLVLFFHGNKYNFFGVILFAFFFLSFVWGLSVEYQGGILLNQEGNPGKGKGLVHITRLRNQLISHQSAQQDNTRSRQVIDQFTPNPGGRLDKKGHSLFQSPLHQLPSPPNPLTSISGTFVPQTTQPVQPAAKEQKPSTSAPKEVYPSSLAGRSVPPLTELNTALKGISLINTEVESKVRDRMKKLKDKRFAKPAEANAVP
ncbi:hypothetical protein [Larkinella harenae]